MTIDVQVENNSVESKVESVEWAEVEGAPRYEVSSLGEVRNKGTGRIMSQFLLSKKYPAVGLVLGGIGGGNSICTVAKLVCKTFHGEPAPGESSRVGYRDGNYLNCSKDNVYWKPLNPGNAEIVERIHARQNRTAEDEVRVALPVGKLMQAIQQSTVSVIDARKVAELTGAGIVQIRGALRSMGYTKEDECWVEPSEN